jgi:N-acetylmuramoyl-L-alanine amidase
MNRVLWALVVLALLAGDGFSKGGKMIVPLKAGDLDLLARVVWAEARSEPFEGQCAIVWVIINRLKRERGRFPNSIQAIIKQPFAFSCFNSSDPQCRKVKTVSEADPTFVEAMRVSMDVMTGKVPSPVGKADHYYLTGMQNPPAWAKKMTLIKRLGSHSFYSELP